MTKKTWIIGLVVVVALVLAIAGSAVALAAQTAPTTCPRADGTGACPRAAAQPSGATCPGAAPCDPDDEAAGAECCGEGAPRAGSGSGCPMSNGAQGRTTWQ